MKGVIVLGEVCEGTLFINAVEYPDGTKRVTHFAEYHGKKTLNCQVVDSYTIYFDDTDEPVKLYKFRNNLWLIDE